MASHHCYCQFVRGLKPSCECQTDSPFTSAYSLEADNGARIDNAIPGWSLKRDVLILNSIACAMDMLRFTSIRCSFIKVSDLFDEDFIFFLYYSIILIGTI